MKKNNLTGTETILFNNWSSSPIIKSFVSDNICKLNANEHVFKNFNTWRLKFTQKNKQNNFRLKFYPGGNVNKAAFVAVVCRRRIGCPIESDFQE